MVCQVVKFGDGFAFVCGPKPRVKKCACGSGKPADLLCDWKTDDTASKTGTCDAAICADCSTRPAPEKDLCQRHARAWVEWRTKRAEAKP